MEVLASDGVGCFDDDARPDPGMREDRAMIDSAGGGGFRSYSILKDPSPSHEPRAVQGFGSKPGIQQQIQDMRDFADQVTCQQQMIAFDKNRNGVIEDSEMLDILDTNGNNVVDPSEWQMLAENRRIMSICSTLPPRAETAPLDTGPLDSGNLNPNVTGDVNPLIL
jgi:hypothetical protein